MSLNENIKNLRDDLSSSNYEEVSNLNKEYTFDNFVITESNRNVYNSIQETIKNLGNMHNPLFIYGAKGTGKTHLLNAIGNFIQEQDNKKVLYTTTNTFLNESSKLSDEEIKSLYTNIDVLIIDDIQYLSKSKKAQQDFFNIFNILLLDCKQMIISSNKSPDSLVEIETSRLRSRLNWGLALEIKLSDYKSTDNSKS